VPTHVKGQHERPDKGNKQTIARQIEFLRAVVPLHSWPQKFCSPTAGYWNSRLLLLVESKSGLQLLMP
jgi:hypothetical protein